MVFKGGRGIAGGALVDDWRVAATDERIRSRKCMVAAQILP